MGTSYPATQESKKASQTSTMIKITTLFLTLGACFASKFKNLKRDISLQRERVDYEQQKQRKQWKQWLQDRIEVLQDHNLSANISHWELVNDQKSTQQQRD